LVGNLTQRQNNNAALTESICYDNLYRLDHTTASGTCSAAAKLQMAYDAMGNITSRSDLAGGAAWTYHATKKHAVLQAGSASNSYTYDANGNAATRNDQLEQL
jgi:YD repeat-containing protein